MADPSRVLGREIARNLLRGRYASAERGRCAASYPWACRRSTTRPRRTAGRRASRAGTRAPLREVEVDLVADPREQRLQPVARSLPGSATCPACVTSIESPGGSAHPALRYSRHELGQRLRIESDDVPVAPEELRNDELRPFATRARRAPRRSSGCSGPRTPRWLGEKLPHAAALLSGRSAGVGVERVEDDLIAHRPPMLPGHPAAHDPLRRADEGPTRRAFRHHLLHLRACSGDHRLELRLDVDRQHPAPASRQRHPGCTSAASCSRIVTGPWNSSSSMRRRRPARAPRCFRT